MRTGSIACLAVSTFVAQTVTVLGFSPSAKTNYQLHSDFSRRVRSQLPSTRTNHHILSAIAFDETGAVINGFFQSQPYVSAFLTCSVKASVADVLAQVKIGHQQKQFLLQHHRQKLQLLNNKNSLSFRSVHDGIYSNNQNSSASLQTMDWKRTTAFLLYGGIYQGIFQEFLYAGMFPKWFPSNDWTSVLCQVGLDMSLFSCCLCLPLAYIVKTIFTVAEPLELTQIVQHGVDKYINDVKEQDLLLKYWGIWIPVQTLNFSIIPTHTHYRIVCMALASFFWMFILSVTSSQETE